MAAPRLAIPGPAAALAVPGGWGAGAADRPAAATMSGGNHSAHVAWSIPQWAGRTAPTPSTQNLRPKWPVLSVLYLPDLPRFVIKRLVWSWQHQSFDHVDSRPARSRTARPVQDGPPGPGRPARSRTARPVRQGQGGRSKGVHKPLREQRLPSTIDKALVLRSSGHGGQGQPALPRPGSTPTSGRNRRGRLPGPSARSGGIPRGPRRTPAGRWPACPGAGTGSGAGRR